MNQFSEAENSFHHFLNNGIDKYAKSRNYDLGPKNRDNTSCLSKYITHRILYEYEIISRIKSSNKSEKYTKFIEEISWRIYWRGYLENNPQIWRNFKSSLTKKFSEGTLEKATGAETGIHCFDEWTKELKRENYLHNHTRMWFASIWIFKLRLPWELGANFFLQHLLDGDAASNTLSWRWVAGLHTNKRPYIANQSNIAKYTASRFNSEQLNINQILIEETSNYIPETKIFKKSTKKKYDNLVFLENDLFFPNILELINKYKKIYIIVINNKDREIQLSNKILEFKFNLIKSFVEKNPETEILTLSEFSRLLEGKTFFDVIYPGVGDSLDILKNISKNNFHKINMIKRDNDLKAWDFARSGFFNFKKKFLSINI